MFDSSGWHSSGENIISARSLTWVYVGCVMMAYLTTAVAAYYVSQPDFVFLVIPAVIGGIIGVFAALKNDCAEVSAVGLILAAVGIGSLIGLVQYNIPGIVTRVFIQGLVLSGIFGVIGGLLPDQLPKWYFWLFGTVWLLVGSIGSSFLITLIFPGLDSGLTMIEMIGVLVIGGYATFDFYRAFRVAYTVDNAIDCAAAIYLDFGVLLFYLLIMVLDY